MHCPIDGWEAAEPLSRSSWQQIWSARKVGSTEVTGMLRVVTIPAYAGEAEALRDGGFSEERIKKHIADCAERCLRDGEALMASGSRRMPEIKAVKLRRSGDGDYRLWILSTYYPTFTKYYEGKRISRGTLLSLFCDLCDAVGDYASVGMVHGAVQLENVYVDRVGSCLLGNPLFKPTLYSRILDPDDTRLLRFIAPEIARGEDYDTRSDICSLGLTMYFKFNGNRLPFVESGRDKVTREEVDSAIVRRLDGEPLPPPIRADAALSEIILRACAPDKNDRYATPAELREAIAAYAEQAGIELTCGRVSPELRSAIAPAEQTDGTEGTAASGADEDGELSFAAVMGLTTAGDSAAAPSGASVENGSDADSSNGASMTGGYFDEHGNFVLTAAASDGDASPSGMNGENDGVHPHEKNNKRGENDERDSASEDGAETQHDDAAEPAAVRDASESDSDIDIAAFAAAADGESAHMGSGVPESSGDVAFTDGANKEHIGNADGYSDGHGEYSDGEKDDPSDADGENGRGGKNGKRRPFPLLPVTFITLGVIAVLVVVIYCMQRFDLFESGNADVADTTAATTATVPDTTELPAGSVRMPDLAGKTRDDAEAELARAGYKGEPIYCGSYSYTADENTVLEQFPAKNIIFNAEDDVELTISLGRAPDTMPDITTLTEKDAFKRLSSLGYNVTVLSAYSDVAAEGTVDMQSVAPGTKIESGTDMFIVTSLGPKPTDFVEITGMSLGAGNLTVESGSTATLTVTFTPDNATEHGIWWHSDDPSKVEVDQSGKIKAVAESGRTVITAMSADGVHSAKRTVVIKAAVKTAETSRVDAPARETTAETTAVRWSDWSETETAGSQSKTQYSSRTKTTRTQSGSPISGWEIDSSRTAFGEWGEWSDWSDMPISSSDVLGVENRTVYSTRARSGWTDSAPAGASDIRTRTVYWYCEKSPDGRPGEWLGPVTDVPSDGKNYLTTEATQYNYVPAGAEWSEWSTDAASAGDSLDVMTNTQYRSRGRDVTYTCYTWSDWSSWSDTPVSEGADTEVKTRTLYRHRV